MGWPNRIALCSCIAATFSAAVAFGGKGASTPSASEIVRKSVLVNSADFAAQTNWAFREREIQSKLDSDGKQVGKRMKTVDVLRIDGSPYQRLVSVEGEPLSPDAERQEQEKLDHEINKRRNEDSKQHEARVAKYAQARSEEHLLMQQMAVAFEFKLVREETVSGVATYVLAATPDPNYRPPVEKARVLTGMQGRIWIDKAHFHWVKVEAEVIKPVEFGLFLAKVKPGTSFELQFAPIGDVWLPKRFVQRVNATVLGVYGNHSQTEEDYSDYHSAMADSVNGTRAVSDAKK